MHTWAVVLLPNINVRPRWVLNRVTIYRQDFGILYLQCRVDLHAGIVLWSWYLIGKGFSFRCDFCPLELCLWQVKHSTFLNCQRTWSHHYTTCWHSNIGCTSCMNILYFCSCKNILYSCNIIGYITVHECFKIHILCLCACMLMMWNIIFCWTLNLSWQRINESAMKPVLSSSENFGVYVAQYNL